MNKAGLRLKMLTVEGLPPGRYTLVGQPKSDGSVQVAVASPDKGVALCTVRGGKVVSVRWMNP